MSTLTVGTISEKVTDAGIAVDGVTLKDGTVTANRLSSDGTIIDLQKDGTSIGNIGVANTDQLSIGTPDGSEMGLRFDGDLQHILPANASGAKKDASADLGSSTARWQNLYLSGGAYIGGTGSANLLSDYEEGTWTPTYGGASGNPTITSDDLTNGSYSKIGQIVHIQGRIRTDATSGGSGALTLTLPFTNITGSSGNEYSVINIGYSNSWSADRFPSTGYILPNQSYGYLVTHNSSDPRDAYALAVQTSNLNNSSNSNDIIFSATYLTDS